MDVLAITSFLHHQNKLARLPIKYSHSSYIAARNNLASCSLFQLTERTKQQGAKYLFMHSNHCKMDRVRIAVV